MVYNIGLSFSSCCSISRRWPVKSPQDASHSAEKQYLLIFNLLKSCCLFISVSYRNYVFYILYCRNTHWTWGFSCFFFFVNEYVYTAHFYFCGYHITRSPQIIVYLDSRFFVPMDIPCRIMTRNILLYKT